ncbi:Fanconi anemia group D2 protein [Temnothorax longispinosus]|uniref:Fanconi anemia group D2 protein n=1 Tax=Temnothorax longispinosus TaxID=300112 RepID=A0A4S2LD09_9HYME|nr:Fanconi anemia group D2 protein [Temnothorax longispinosus]
MKKVLNLKQYQKIYIIDSIEEHIRNEENFEKMLKDVEISTDNGFGVLSKMTFARILLEVTEIQTDVYNIFMSKLNESILLADTLEEVPWAALLLHQFRFLDTITDIDILTTNIQQLLETCPLWFQHELILFLPDVLSDAQHQTIAEILTKMLEENCELTNVILNCIASFNLGKEYLEEYKIKVLQLLKTNMKIELVPIVIRFLLNDCVSSDIVKQMLFVLRNIEMQPLAGDKAENCYKNQVQIIKTLKICMLLAKDVTDVAITVIKDINKNPKPLDLIILIVIFSGTIRQKNAEALLKQNIRCGFYRISLLHTLYNDYKEVVRELQSSILQLAGKLLKSEERVFIIFAIEWFRLQFLSQKEMPFKQREIVKNTILLMGNNDQTMKHALNVLCKMAENSTERGCLVSHCNHLRILLEKIDCFGLEEVGILSDLLHGLCLADDSTSESLRDDLFILLQKQLSSAKPITKCKGVMGAVMAIKHLAEKAETCDQALKLFKGLRTLARQVNEENALLRSCKELVAESYKYFESLLDIATEIALANVLVNMCQSLMKHSETYVQEYKGKHAKLAYEFLCSEWPEDKHTGPQYKLSVIQLLNNWMDNEPSPLKAVTSILKWLPDEVYNFENVQSSLTRIPSVKKYIFHLLYKKLFDGLIKGINIALLAVNSDPKRIKVWHNITSNVQKLVQICKTLQTKPTIRLFLRYMPLLIKQFLNTGMPILEHNLKYQTDDVTSILKMMQKETPLLDMNKNLEELVNASSEILDSDLGEKPIEETEDENEDIDDL